jgi:hypothetical protein
MIFKVAEVGRVRFGSCFFLTNHQSPITNHQSPIINHQSSIINHHPIQLLVAPLPPGFEGGSKGHGVGLN